MHHRPVCVLCEVEYRPSNNDTVVVDYFLDPPQPYQLWGADEWACPKCDNRIIFGFGEVPVAHHFQKDLMADLLLLTNSELLRHNYVYKGMPNDS